MLLKVKTLKLLAGRPIAILHQDTAEWLNMHASDRIRISKYRKKQVIVAPIDITGGGTILSEDEIALSSEIFKELGLRNHEIVEVNPALRPLSVNYVLKKLNKKKLTFTEIYTIISDIVNNELTEAEVAYFVSGVYLNGMSIDEVVSLTRAMVKTGHEFKINRKIVFDKHSIGGLAGNRTTPIVTSIIASIIRNRGLNAAMPKTSSRAITSAAGTADVMETVAQVEFSVDEMKRIIDKTNACLVWGGSLGLAPADDKIIQIERLLSLDPDAQLIASILSKKLAVNASHVLIDIPFGPSAKMDRIQALRLKEKFESIASHFNIKLKVVLTDGSQPIGNGIGPCLEMRDVLSVLRQDFDRPIDLENKCVFLATELLSMVPELGMSRDEIEKEVKLTLNNKTALDKFLEIVKEQKGALDNFEDKLRLGTFKFDVKAKHPGIVKAIDNKGLAQIARIAGCPSDARAGILIHKHLGSRAKKNHAIYTIYAETKDKLEYAKSMAEQIKPFMISNK